MPITMRDAPVDLNSPSPHCTWDKYWVEGLWGTSPDYHLSQPGVEHYYQNTTYSLHALSGVQTQSWTSHKSRGWRTVQQYCISVYFFLSSTHTLRRITCVNRSTSRLTSTSTFYPSLAVVMMMALNLTVSSQHQLKSIKVQDKLKGTLWIFCVVLEAGH